MLLISFGTKSEYLKIKSLLPLLDKDDIAYKLLQIEENYFDVTEPRDIMQIYDISSNKINNIQLNVLDQAENWFNGVKAILVVGDSTSAFAMALAAYTRSLKIIHLDAGIRTYDVNNFYPEEFNRRSISLIADVNICTTNRNAKELSQEGIRSTKYVTGSTLLDSIDLTPLEQNNTVFISFKTKESLAKWNPEITKLSKTTLRLSYIYDDGKDTINNIKRSTIIISNDSNIQTIACYLNKKTIICNKATELTESIWLNSTLCKTPDYLSTAFWKIFNKTLTNYICPYGLGDSSQKVIEILKKELV
jgi:UDP-N-acetylglucosamine 2-epimerase